MVSRGVVESEEDLEAYRERLRRRIEALGEEEPGVTEGDPNQVQLFSSDPT
jgi:hypothetical protein